MSNRFGSSSILPQKFCNFCASNSYEFEVTASSSDFSYLFKGGTGFVRALASTSYGSCMNFINVSVIEEKQSCTTVMGKMVGRKENEN